MDWLPTIPPLGSSTVVYDADGAILRAARATPLPSGMSLNATPFTATSGTPISTHVASTEPPPVRPKPDLGQESPTPQRPRRSRRARPPSLDIYTETDPAHRLPQAKKTAGRKDGRTPLDDIGNATNCTPSLVPRYPSTPVHLSTDDPFWSDFENYFPQQDRSPTPEPSSIPTPQPSAQSQAPPRRNARRSRPRPRRVIHAVQAPRPVIFEPKSMVLYDLLEISDWRASSVVVRMAYRQVAIKYHPDKVAEGERAAATVKMQHINAAKELLLDPNRRAKYNRDGELPWST